MNTSSVDTLPGARAHFHFCILCGRRGHCECVRLLLRVVSAPRVSLLRVLPPHKLQGPQALPSDFNPKGTPQTSASETLGQFLDPDFKPTPALGDN